MKGNLGKTKETSQIKVLSVGLNDEESTGLSAIFTRSEWPMCPDAEWKLQISQSLRMAIASMGKERPHILVCEKDFGDHSWRDLLDQARRLPDPPAVIVASRTADEYLWAEALNLGAYDVLAAPLDPAEVVRVLSSAWLHRVHREELTASRSVRGALPGQAAYVAAG